MSKVTGIVRNFDELGRIVIPKELRKTMGFETGTPVEIIGQDNGILLKKFGENSLEEENKQLRERLAKINGLAVDYQNEGPFSGQEAFNRVKEIDSLSILEAGNEKA